MIDMTKAEILDVWKGFVRNMTDQGAVVPFAREIARLVRSELLAQVEAAEKERDDVAQQLVQSEQGKRKISEECDALCARIEAMEKQEPDAWCATYETGAVVEALVMNQSRRFDTALYLATGAQPAPSIPAVDALAQFIREIDGARRLGAGVLAERIVAWLAAAPEAKPCP